MIDPEQWMPLAEKRLRKVFGGRLLYLGLQGSYGRGEATESSDIDVVALVDAFALRDLDAYRSVVRALPEGEKACGFFGDPATLLAWPRHELFSLKIDTADRIGSLEAFLPPIGRGDAEDAARNGAAALYHPLVHTWLYGDGAAQEAFARAAFKSAFFLLRIVHFLRTGEVAPDKKTLGEKLSGSEKTIALAGLPGSGWLDARPLPESYELLLEWTRGILAVL